jgi:probable rRNA maturation factor
MKKLVTNLRREVGRTLNKKLPREVAVIYISSRQSQTLNRVYRHKNKATNVLSFRFDKNYGEILICLEVVRREARVQGNSYKYQMTWMVLHGMLHLAGLHHERSKAVAKRVDDLERKLLRKLFPAKRISKS